MLSSCAEGLPLPFPEETGIPVIGIYALENSSSGNFIEYPNNSTFYFGTLSSGAGISTPFIISNTGAGNLVVNTMGITGSGSAFSFVQNPADFAGKIIAANSSLEFSIEFADGLAVDVYTGVLNVSSNDPEHPALHINLHGSVE